MVQLLDVHSMFLSLANAHLPFNKLAGHVAKLCKHSSCVSFFFPRAYMVTSQQRLPSFFFTTVQLKISP